MPLPYPYDPLGTAVSNRILNEVHAVTAPVNPEAANWIVPTASPYHAITLIVRTGPLLTDPVLVDGVDYIYTHYFVELSQHIHKPVYGSIMFTNRNYTGTVYLTYQTVGGPFTLASTTIVENLTRTLYNIRTVTWGQVVGVPQFFPPAPHLHDVADLTSMVDVVNKLNELVVAITLQSANIPGLVSTLSQHLTSLAAHTPAQIGLGNVPNYAVADLADVMASATNKLMTPDLTNQAIQLIADGLATFANLTAEALARQTADGILRDDLDAEVLARGGADGILRGDLDAEVTTRDGQTTALQLALDAEITTRSTDYGTLTGALAAEVLARSTADGIIQGNLDTEVTTRDDQTSALQIALGVETQARINGYDALNGSLTAEITNRGAGDDALTTALGNEVTARIAGDDGLQHQIDILSTTLTGIAGSPFDPVPMQNAIIALQGSLTTLQNGLAGEIVDRAMAIAGVTLPTPAAPGLLLTTTGNTAGAYAWAETNVMHNRAVEAAHLHDGFELVWDGIVGTIRLMPKNGGLIWVNGNLHQIPSNGITYALMTNYTTWYAHVNANTMRGKSFWVVVKEDGMGGLVLDLTRSFYSTAGLDHFALKDPYLGTYLAGRLSMVLHPTTHTPSMWENGGGGYHYEMTTVGSIKLADHGGYYAGYAPQAGIAGNMTGNFVHSLDSSGTMEHTFFMYRYGKLLLNGLYQNVVFKQDAPAITKRYVPDVALNNNIPNNYGEFLRFDGSKVTSLIGCASAYVGDFTADFEIKLQMTSASGNERLWAGVGDADDFIYTMEEWPDTPGDWPNPPSYIASNGLNLPYYGSWSPIVNSWNVGGSAHGRVMVNAAPAAAYASANIFAFADNASFGAPTSSIKLMNARVRLWRKNSIWRRDL